MYWLEKSNCESIEHGVKILGFPLSGLSVEERESKPKTVTFTVRFHAAALRWLLQLFFLF